MWQKIIRFVLFPMVMTLLIGQTGMALEDYGPVTSWYSDSVFIGYLDRYANPVGVGKTVECGMADANLLAYSSHAIAAWGLTGYTFTLVTGQAQYDSAPLKILCISRSAANRIGIPSNAVGSNSWTQATMTGTGLPGGKYTYAISRYQTYLIWDTCTWCLGRTDNRTDFLWKATAAHEHGHGIGYSGHNGSDGTQLMYTSSSSCGCNLPQSKDKNHMRNVYTVK